MRPSLIVGLTGGIASGKSTVSAMFEELGTPVIDADVVARELVAPGTPALGEIAAQFGTELLSSDGSLDRGKLRARVFGDDSARVRLEAILHPRIRREMLRRIETLRSPYCILAVPLLLETGLDSIVDRVLVVDAEPALQIQRAAQRDSASPEAIEDILRTQMDRAKRLKTAHDVVDNQGGIESLRRQVDVLHRRYLAMGTGSLPAHRN